MKLRDLKLPPGLPLVDQIKLNAIDRMVRKAKPLNIEKFPVIL